MTKHSQYTNEICNRYAKAIILSSSSKAELEKINEDFADFCNLIKDPTINQEDLSKVIYKITENNKFDVLFKNFLNFLIQKRRFFFVESILKSFIETCSRKRGELKAKLRSAKSLSNDEIIKITDLLTKNFSSKIKLDYEHDESLIGGLVVQVGSAMVDTSIKNKLQQIENKMIEA